MNGLLTNTDFEVINYLYDKCNREPNVTFEEDCFKITCSPLGNDNYYMMVEEYLRNELQDRFIRTETNMFNSPVFLIEYGSDVQEMKFEKTQSYKERKHEVKAVQFKIDNIEELKAFTGGGIVSKRGDEFAYMFVDSYGNVNTIPEGTWLVRVQNGVYSMIPDDRFKEHYTCCDEEREKETLSEIRDQMQALAKMITNNCTCAKEVLTKDEAAIYLGVSVSYLHKLTANRQIPFYVPFGKQHYFKRSELDEWVTQNKITEKNN